MIQKGYYKFNNSIAPFPPSSSDNFTFFTNGIQWDTLTIDALGEIIEYNANVVYLNEEWEPNTQRIYIPNNVNLSASLETLLTSQAYFNFKVTYNNEGMLTYLEHTLFLPSTLPEPSRSGYVFKGWYYDENFTQPAEPDDELINDVVLYAKWGIETFTIDFYKSSAEPSKVDKTSELILITTLNGKFRNAISFQELQLDIERDMIPNFNYCYIRQLKRYYFVNNITMNGYRSFTLDLKEDVLMTFKDNILSTNAIIERQENNYNDLLLDNEVILENKNIIEEVVATLPAGALYRKNVDPTAMTSDDCYIVLITTR